MKSVSLQRYLLTSCQKGDPQAQQEVYHLYADAMYATCRRMMGDEEDAKDVLQEAFIQVFAKIGTLKDLNSFPSWIKRVVINKCLGALRKQVKFVSIEEEKELSLDSAAIAFNQEPSYQAKQILTAIDQISDGCKAVLNLYLFEGYDHKEIAQIMGFSVSTSKAQYSKARSKVRKLVAEMNAS